jgi:hypothetical protein
MRRSPPLRPRSSTSPDPGAAEPQGTSGHAGCLCFVRIRPSLACGDTARKCLTITVVALSANCARPALTPAASTDGASRLGPREGGAGCLRYPANILPPVPGTLAFGHPQILTSASGKVVLVDGRWRMIVWNPAAGPDGLLLPGGIDGLVAGPGDVLFHQGSVTRLSLLDGDEDGRISGEECGVGGGAEPSRGEGPTIRGAPDRPVVGLIPPRAGRAARRGSRAAAIVADGGAVFQLGEGMTPGCTVVYRETAPEWKVADAQATRDLLVLTEWGPHGALRAVFHRGGGQDRLVAIDLFNYRVEIAADTIVFWSEDAGSILVASARDPAPTPRRVTLFPELPHPISSSCLSVEGTAGRFVLFRKQCLDEGPESVERVLFDANEKRTIARLHGITGPAGVTPDGRIIAAGPEGVCPVREK